MDHPIPVKPTDVVKCRRCSHSAPLQSFRFVSWQTFREPNLRGKLVSVTSGYFYCQCQADLPLLSDEVKLPDSSDGKKAKKIRYAKPIAYRQGGSNRWPRIILSFPKRDRIVKRVRAKTFEPSRLETLELVCSP